jgi:hypothetical protein
MKAKMLFILGLSFLLIACGDGRPEQLQANTRTAEYLTTNLGENLDTNALGNASILSEYGRLLGQDKPQLKPLLTQLSRDATRQGPMYQGLLQRLKTLKEQPQVLGDIEAQLFESENLIAASDPALFNDALSDPINVIADLSDGKLARVNAISKQQSLQANAAADNGAGSQLVGNPGYGQWQTNSGGTSFWQWYGMYSMFSALTPNRTRYDSWSSRRDYSYYNDVGRNRYTSPQQAKSQDNLAARTKKKFANKGGFRSPYAKSKTGASRMSTASRQAQQATSFAGKSNYSKAKSSSSFRNSKTTTSRGISRGK